MCYEITALINEGEKEVLAFWDALIGDIEKEGALVEKRVSPRKKNLAYPIRHKGGLIQHVFAGTLYIKIKPKQEAKELLPRIQEALAQRAQVVRSMISRVSHIPEEKPLAPSRPSRVKRLEEQVATKSSDTRETQSAKKEEKPSLEQLDKKLEEILEDNIGY